MKNFISLLIAAMTMILFIPARGQTFNIPINAGDSVVKITVEKIKKNVVTPAPVDPTPSGYVEVFRSNFDNLSDLDPDDNKQAGNSYIDFNNPITAPGSFHSLTKANVSGGTRGEVQYKDSRTPSEGAITYKVKYNYIVKDQCHSFQFHSNVSGSSAVLALWHMAGRFVVRVNNGSSNISQAQPTKNIVAGVVYSMRVEYKFHSTAGYYRWYINDTLYAQYNGPLKNGSGQYLKIGLNGGFTSADVPEALRSDIIYDDLRIYAKV